MIKVESCTGCGRIIYVQPVANLKVRLESEPLDGRSAVQAVVAGRNLWKIADGEASGVRPDTMDALHRGEEVYVVQEHRCAPAGRPDRPAPATGSTQAPKGRETGVQSLAGRSTPSPARPTARSSAPAAVTRVSERPVCDGCGQPCADGTYASVAVGEILVWAHHVIACETAQNGA